MFLGTMFAVTIPSTTSTFPISRRKSSTFLPHLTSPPSRVSTYASTDGGVYCFFSSHGGGSSDERCSPRLCSSPKALMKSVCACMGYRMMTGKTRRLSGERGSGERWMTASSRMGGGCPVFRNLIWRATRAAPSVRCALTLRSCSSRPFRALSSATFCFARTSSLSFRSAAFDGLLPASPTRSSPAQVCSAP